MFKAIIGFCGDVKGKSFLDIGPCFGYFCFKLTKMGARTTGIEYNKERFNVCRCLSKIYGFDESNPKFINMDIMDCQKPLYEKYDYVLLLNIFHHILVQNTSDAWRMLNTIAEESEAIFITMAHEKGLNAKSQREIPEIIIQNSVLTHFKKLGMGRGRENRTIYVFWK